MILIRAGRPFQLRVAPNAQFFNTLLVVYTRANHEEGVEQVLKELAARGFEPDVHSYTWRISKCSSVGKVQDMMQAMVDQGLRPNLYTIAAVVCVCVLWCCDHVLEGLVLVCVLLCL